MSAQIGSFSIHLACHLQIDAYPDVDPDPTFQFKADPDAQHWLRGGACYTCSYPPEMIIWGWDRARGSA
jgi:hypothetical protein